MNLIEAINKAFFSKWGRTVNETRWQAFKRFYLKPKVINKISFPDRKLRHEEWRRNDELNIRLNTIEDKLDKLLKE